MVWMGLGTGIEPSTHGSLGAAGWGRALLVANLAGGWVLVFNLALRVPRLARARVAWGWRGVKGTGCQPGTLSAGQGGRRSDVVWVGLGTGIEPSTHGPLAAAGWGRALLVANLAGVDLGLAWC